MDIRKLQRAIVDGLEDVKAQNIVVFNTEHLSPLFERVIIASGTSNRQTKSLASSVRDAVKRSGFPVLRTEGEANGEWIIVDCGAAVVHVMQPSIREYYYLEEIWGEKPVNMKLNSAAVKLVKASEPDKATRSKRAPAVEAATRKKPAKKAPARQAAPKRPPANRAPAHPVAVKRAGSAGASTGAKVPARRPPPPVGKAVVTRVVGVKRASAKAPAAPKGAAVKKTFARAAPATRAPARAAPAKSAPAKSAPARSAPAKRAPAPKAAVKKAVARKSPSRA
jgi:ribosome-associated protein